jgi:Bifunctional DNA primase/polymerase, N-terminal/Primase C terminal 2 (PriCT-2)
MKNERLDAASVYVKQRKWWIFPVPPGTKMGYSVKQRGHDNGRAWGKTSDVTEVRAYWKRLPRANIGLVMGVDSGIFDIETDTKVGHANLEQDGATSLAALERRHGRLTSTSMFVSPTGSMHRLYRHPGGDVRIRTGVLDKDFPGIDVKGDGGMSVAPPSKTSKGVYRWINKRRIAMAPQWLLDLVRKPARAPDDVWQQYANSTKQASIEELTLATAMIPNPDIPWDPDKNTPGWNGIGMALFAATEGSAEGFRLFDAFSKRSAKYNEATTRAKWEAFHRCPPHEIGAGTMLYLAEQAEPNWRERIYARDPKVIKLLKEFHKLLGEP